MRWFRSTALFLFLSAVWGTAFVAISAGLADLPPVLFAALRYDIAGVLMLLYVYLWADDWRPRARSEYVAILIGSLLMITLYNAFLFIGQVRVTSAIAAIIVAMSPILSTAFTAILLPQHGLSRIQTLGLLCGFVGVAIVVWPSPEALLHADLIASLFVLAAAVCVALGSVLIQRNTSTISAEALVAWSCIGGAILLHIFSGGMPSEQLSMVEVTPRAVISLLYLAVGASAIGYVIYFQLLDQLGAIQINLVSYAAPVFAALFGWLLLGETIGLRTVAGFVIITLGFLLMKRREIARIARG